MLPKETFDKLHAKVQTCLVRIVAIREGKPTLFAPGIVIAKKKLSCYIITDKDTFGYGSGGLYAVVFPSNSEKVAINFFDVSFADNLASFMLSKPKGTSPLAAVQISEYGPSLHEDVYTLGYHNPQAYPTHLSPGSVRFVGEADFVHDCVPAICTAFGSPVFTVDGLMLGICFENRGVVKAYKVQSLMQHVAKIHPQMKHKASKDILQHFMDQRKVLLEKRKPQGDASVTSSKKSKAQGGSSSQKG